MMVKRTHQIVALTQHDHARKAVRTLVLTATTTQDDTSRGEGLQAKRGSGYRSVSTLAAASSCRCAA